MAQRLSSLGAALWLKLKRAFRFWAVLLKAVAMTVLQVADLSFGYGADKLFSNVTFSMEMGERAALLAPNGAGKSTLLRLIAKELVPDSGLLLTRKDVRVAYFRQSHELPPAGNVLDAFLSGFADILELRHELVKAQHEAASGTDEALARLSRASDRYHIEGGDALERRVEMIAQHLGFTAADMERPLSSLSGGERGRLNLGVVLAQSPDLLLLDEPTNHLDLDTIDWLTQYLKNIPGAVLVVSHDRAFLDAVCPSTMELGRKGLYIYPLRYSDYVLAREDELSRQRALSERQEAFVAKTEEFIRRNIAGQKTKQAQSRRKMLDKLEVQERPEDVWAVAERVRFRFQSVPRSGDIVLDARNLCAQRGGRVLFSHFDLLVKRGDRIGIVGPNGSGKSTLLRLLSGRGDAEDLGDVKRGTNLYEGYFDQHLGSLDLNKSAVEEIRSVRGDMNVDVTRQYLSRFRFYGDDVFRRVSGFSGGERSRLSLAKLLLEPLNLLFLDEPTNHLDIPAAEILEEALSDFEGTVIFVSHDRRFLEGVASRILSVRDGRVDAYPGGFGDYEAHLEKVAKELKEAKEAEEQREPSPGREKKTGAKEKQNNGAASQVSSGDFSGGAQKRRSFEADKAAARALEKKKRRLSELESEIAKGEEELSRMRELLKQDPGGDWAKLAERVKEEQAFAKKVEAWMSEWMALGEELEALS